MKLFIFMLTFGLVIANTAQVEAATKRTSKVRQVKAAAKAKTASKKKAAVTSEAKTSHNFEDHGVTGEYQMPDEALAKVENEKSLSDLLGVRKHFKDRLVEASEQE